MNVQQRITYFINQFTLFFFLFIGGLAASRIVYELLFPRLLWLGIPLFVLPLVAIFTFILWLIIAPKSSQYGMNLAPLLLNFIYLGNPSINLVESRLIFLASLWICALLFCQSWLKKRPSLGFLFIILALLPIYLLTVSTLVGKDDTFEFQVVTPNLGIVHPTGYPLYLLLGRLFTLLPFNSVAWRLNFGSIVYAITAVCLLYWTLQRWWKRPLPAIFTATAIGTSLTFWSQAIVAEVYALHALIVSLLLTLLFELFFQNPRSFRPVYIIAIVLGLGMTNHVTTVFMLLPTIAALLFLKQRQPDFPLFNPRHILKGIGFGLLPLLLYTYLPLRWRAVNQEPMGVQRFIDWVVGGRFQDALVWRAWLNDPTRYEVVGRLFLENWGWFNLLVAGIGFGFLLYRSWKTAVLLLLIFLGYTFYCLNYYVPDLAVFLIPAQMMIGIFWGAAIKEGLGAEGWGLGFDKLGLGKASGLTLQPIFLFLFLIPTISGAAAHWRINDRSGDDGRTRWGTAVLAQPIIQNAAILADSLKFPPLFYLQQSEGLREDLDISVWPDEDAYREQLAARLEAGQAVYLARFLPGLESSYHLNSAGPIIHVARSPQTILPPEATPTNISFGSVQLIGFALQPQAATDGNASAVTLYWQMGAEETAVQPNPFVYVRWQGFDATSGQHPANNFYPFAAWKDAEIVSDYHEWPYPTLSAPQSLIFQVALGAPFATEADLTWQTITTAQLEPNFDAMAARPLRMVIDNTAVTGLTTPDSSRPLSEIDLMITGIGEGSVVLDLKSESEIRNVSGISLPAVSEQSLLLWQQLMVGEDNGRYAVTATAQNGAYCGWLRPQTTECTLTEITVSGVPLPKNAINFEDKIALLNAKIEQSELIPGKELSLDLTWQSLSPLEEDYTVFIQLLNEQDKIVGQIDSWPLQGTLPTTQWQAGEQINDPYTIQLDSELPPGNYKIHLGFYLLATFQRLSIVDDSGNPINNYYLIEGLRVGE